MTSLTVPLPDKLNEQLTEAARQHRVTPARFVLKTIETRLRKANEPLAASLYDLSRDLCGSVRKAPPDLARNKRHLQGYGSWKR